MARILVVDDAADIRSVIARGLAHAHEIVTATNGVEAIAMIKGGDRFDVILSDVMMPGLDGVGFYIELLEYAPDQARSYFDTIDHGHLRAFLDRRVTDGVIRRMIDKWLTAGVLEEDAIKRSDVGTPQGGVISPLLANIFLHYVVDEWFARDVVPCMKAKCALVRYCDDFVMVFEDFVDCDRVQRVLGKRLAKYGLALHPEKTKRVDFRFKRPNGERHTATQATTFDFLGFTHLWGKTERGKHNVYQRTAKDRFARALLKVTDWCRRNRHRPVPEQHVRLSRMMKGHFAYFGITGNSRRIRWYAHQVERIWFSSLRRRSRGERGGYRMFDALLQRHPLPPPRIVHRYAAASEPVT